MIESMCPCGRVAEYRVRYPEWGDHRGKVADACYGCAAKIEDTPSPWRVSIVRIMPPPPPRVELGAGDTLRAPPLVEPTTEAKRRRGRALLPSIAAIEGNGVRAIAEVAPHLNGTKSGRGR